MYLCYSSIRNLRFSCPTICRVWSPPDGCPLLPSSSPLPLPFSLFFFILPLLALSFSLCQLVLAGFFFLPFLALSFPRHLLCNCSQSFTNSLSLSHHSFPLFCLVPPSCFRRHVHVLRFRSRTAVFFVSLSIVHLLSVCY